MVKKYLGVVVVALFVILVAVQANKSYVLDELDFPVVSRATSLTGKPIYYRGEDSPAHVGTYHPTLYINSLASFIRVFGYNESSVRFFGVVCTLLSAYLLILIYKQLSSRPNKTVELIFLALFLLNPYTIANTTLPDIDSTVLPVLLLLFIYFAIKKVILGKEIVAKTAVILGLLFNLILWSKLTTPLILPPLLFYFVYIVTKNFKKSLVFTARVTIIGMLGFAFTYFIYCKTLNLQPTYTYKFLIESFTKGTSGRGLVSGLINNLSNVKTFIYWPTIPLSILLVISSLSTIFKKATDKKDKVVRSLALTGSLVTVFYISLISPFGGFFKYPFPVFGLLILTLVFFLENGLSKLSRRLVMPVLSLCFGFVIEKLVWGDQMFKDAQPFRALIPVAVISLILSLYISYRQSRLHRYAELCLVLLAFFAIGFQISISRIQSKAQYSTKYLYGQQGMDDAAAYLRSNTSRDEVIWSMKDIGYYVNNRYVESYAYYFNKPSEKELINMLRKGKIRYYVTTTGIGQDNIDYYKNIANILNKYATREKQFDNFVIYKSMGVN